MYFRFICPWLGTVDNQRMKWFWAEVPSCLSLSRSLLSGYWICCNWMLFQGYVPLDDLGQDQWSKIIQIKVYPRNRWFLSQNGIISSFDASRSEWSWITDPDPDYMKGTHTNSISILLLLSGNLKGHISSANLWGKLLP